MLGWFKRSRAPTLIVMLIPKTGGTTLREVLKRAYGGDELFLPDTPATRFDRDLEALPSARRRRLRCVGGHLFYGTHAKLPSSARYATVLRDPVDRVVSHYYYIRRRPDAGLYQLANELSLDEFVRRPFRPLDNAQVRFVSGVGYRPEAGACGPKELAAAKDHLDGFIAVGLTERFDESLEMFSRVFGWAKMVAAPRNVSEERPALDAIDPDTIAYIRQANELDADLYEHARRLFERQLEVPRGSG